MKKNYWYFLAIFAAFVSMLTVMPHHLTVAQAEEDEIDETINEEENSFSRSSLFDPDEPTPDDIDEQDNVQDEEGGGRGDDDNGDDDNGDDDNGDDDSSDDDSGPGG